MTPARISVVVPALDEGERIAGALRSAAQGRNVECVVADGGSRDGTLHVAERLGARIVRAAPPRAAQMNAGAAAATGELLLFLHADATLPEGYDAEVRTLLSLPGVAGGAFRLRLEGTARGLGVVAAGANWRARHLGLPYGDQALFLTLGSFRKLGGFTELPIMEDFEFVRRLRRLGRIAISDRSVHASARRWERLGAVRTTLINQLVIAGYHAGIAPRRLAGWYDRRGSLDGGRIAGGERAR